MIPLVECTSVSSNELPRFIQTISNSDRTANLNHRWAEVLDFLSGCLCTTFVWCNNLTGNKSHRADPNNGYTADRLWGHSQGAYYWYNYLALRHKPSVIGSCLLFFLGQSPQDPKSLYVRLHATMSHFRQHFFMLRIRSDFCPPYLLEAK
jgi:hypothetical protein